MKLFLFPSFAAILFLTANAQAQTNPVLYAELNAGAVFPSDLEIETFTFDDGVDMATIDASADFGIGVAGGVEIGWQNLFSNNFRFGVSYDYLQANVDTLSASGVFNGEPFDITVDVNGPILLDDATTVDLEIDEQVHAILGNLYWQASTRPLEPFAGVGLGTAYIDETGFNLAAAGAAGARYYVGRLTFIGAKYKYLRAFDVTDDFGVNYKDVSAHVFLFTFGAHY